MTEKFIRFTDNDSGRQVTYERYAARLPAFLKEYGPKDGYRVEIAWTDLLAVQTGRVSLMREAVIASKKPSDVGLPGIQDDVDVLVCTAKLLDAQKRIVRNASAAMSIRGKMDFRTLETAANQRLLAALGFVGEELDAQVTIEDDVIYKRYAARIPAFLNAYPPKEGYCVVISWTDLLSLQTGRLSLLREAVIAGRKPSDVGLPGIENDVNTLVCTARLLDPQEQVVRSGSATMQVLEFKDFEKLETAANQRLLAALGFGGEVFDEDENADLAAQGRTPDASSTAESSAGASASPPAPSAPLSFEGSASTSVGSEPPDDSAEVTAAERRQIENLASRVGASVPPLKTRSDVKQARRQLSALDRQRRTGARTEQSAATA